MLIWLLLTTNSKLLDGMSSLTIVVTPPQLPDDRSFLIINPGIILCLGQSKKCFVNSCYITFLFIPNRN